MKIPFVDLKSQYKSIKEEVDTVISEVLTSTEFIGGKYVEGFRKDFKKLYGVKHCVPVGNGTDSLYIIMKMLGIGVGDEVITPANSWISSSETISQTGAKPVFVDIEQDYFTIDVERIEDLINENTKAIIPVHLYGQACDLEGIIRLADKYKLHIIEDCAQAHFTKYKGKNVGLFGVSGSFSFYPGKNLGAYGDAGCIITNDNDLAKKCTMYANHGALKKHYHEFEGINSRMDGIQAAILTVKLKRIETWTEQRIQNATAYSEKLELIDEVETPKIRPNTKHTFHLYVIRCKKRDSLREYLKAKGIATGIHYPNILPGLEAYSYLDNSKHEFKNALLAQDEILSLPMFPELTEEQIDYIVENIKLFYGLY